MQWDLAVEKDTPDKELGANESDEPDVAPQLLFIHQVCKRSGSVVANYRRNLSLRWFDSSLVF